MAPVTHTPHWTQKSSSLSPPTAQKDGVSLKPWYCLQILVLQRAQKLQLYMTELQNTHIQIYIHIHIHTLARILFTRHQYKLLFTKDRPCSSKYLAHKQSLTLTVFFFLKNGSKPTPQINQSPENSTTNRDIVDNQTT